MRTPFYHEDNHYGFFAKCPTSFYNQPLLTFSLNSAIRNKSFSIKISGNGDRAPGYKNSTSLLLTKEICDAAESDPQWDEKHIADRAKKLYEEFIVLWPNYSRQTAIPSSTSEDPDISKFTAEQLADPTKLLEAISG